MVMQRRACAICGRQRLVRDIVVRGPDAAAGDDRAALADQLPQAHRGRCDVILVVADDLYAHQVHAAAARSAWRVTGAGAALGRANKAQAGGMLLRPALRALQEFQENKAQSMSLVFQCSF